MAERLGRVFALALLAPVLLHLIGRGTLDGAWLVLLLTGAPVLLALGLGRGGAGRDEVAWLTALGAALAAPLLPTIFRVDGFDTPLAVTSGALVWLAWNGRLTALTAAPRWGRVARTFFAVWAAWSIGSALRGFVAWQPEGAPWTADLLWAVVTDPFGYRSLIDPVRPFGQLFLRLETVLFAWSGFELALGALGRGDGARFERRFAGALAWGLGLGLVASVAEFSAAAIWRGDSSVWARAAAGIGRNPRPLLDHNALGSALVLILPLSITAALLFWRRRRRLVGDDPKRTALPWVGFGLGVASLIGLALLVSSRSKAALGGFALALPLAFVFYALSRGGPLRRWALGLVAAGLLVVAGLNLVPASWLEPVTSTRYGHDLVRVARFDAAADYLTENRVVVWKRALAVGREHPVVGVGLGRLPLLLGEHHDPAAPGWFNPRNENAHSQYLQWLGEEGWVGLGLGLLLFVGALLGGLRRQSGLSLAGSAGLCGLALTLVVGHALLVSSVALLFAGLVGWLLAGGSMTRVPDEAAGSAGRRPWLAPTAAGLAFGLAFLPLLLPGGSRPLPLADYTFGCYPWDFLPGDGPKRARSVGPDARWFLEWRSSDVLKIPIRDVRDPRFEELVRVTLAVNGKVVVQDKLLPHQNRAELAADPMLTANRETFLRIERPAGVSPGDLVELRLTSSGSFVGSRIYHPDHRRVAARMWPAF